MSLTPEDKLESLKPMAYELTQQIENLLSENPAPPTA